jgi:hypothetical protein
VTSVCVQEQQLSAREYAVQVEMRYLWPIPSVPLSFQPHESTFPASVTASVCRDPATTGRRLKRNPLKEVPSRLSMTLGRSASCLKSSPSCPSSVTPHPKTTTSIGGLVQYEGSSATSWPAVVPSLLGDALQSSSAAGSAAFTSESSLDRVIVAHMVKARILKGPDAGGQ